MKNNTANGADNQIEPFRIPLLRDMSDGPNRCLAVLATFENQEHPAWCYDLGYTYLGNLLGKKRLAAIVQVKALKKSGYVEVKDMGMHKGAHLRNKIRVNWVKVIAETEPVLAEKRAKYKARGVVCENIPGGMSKHTLVPNYLPEEKKVVGIVSAPAKASAAGGPPTQPERTREKRITLQKTSRLRGENLKAMVQSWKHDVYKVWADSGGKVEGLDDWIPILEDGTGRTKKDLENFTKAVLSAYEHDLPVYAPDEVMRYALARKGFWGKPNPFKPSKRLYPESWYIVKTVRRFITAMEESECN